MKSDSQITNKSLIGLLHWVIAFWIENWKLKINDSLYSYVIHLTLHTWYIYLQIWQTVYGAMGITLLSCINILPHAVTVLFHWELKVYAKIKIIVQIVSNKVPPSNFRHKSTTNVLYTKIVLKHCKTWLQNRWST